MIATQPRLWIPLKLSKIKQFQSERGRKNLESVSVAESRRALRPAIYQSVTLCPGREEGELALGVANRSVALRPAGLSAIAVADDLSKSPVFFTT